MDAIITPLLRHSYATIMSAACLVAFVGNARILCCARNLFTNHIHVFYTKTIALANISIALTGVPSVVLAILGDVRDWHFGHILCFVYLLSRKVPLTLPPYLIALYNFYTAKHLGTLDATDADAPASRYRGWVPCLLLTIASAVIWTGVILLLNDSHGSGYYDACFFMYNEAARFLAGLLLLFLIPLNFSWIFYRRASTHLKSLVDDEQTNYEQDSQLLRFNKAINLVYFSLASAGWILYLSKMAFPIVSFIVVMSYVLLILNLSFPLSFVVLHACFNPSKTS